jgi:uncharacterized protein (DUF4415 family)
MKKPSSSKVSKTNWERLRATRGDKIKLSREHPEIDSKHVARVVVRRGLRPVPPKTSLALRVDADVVEWFKAQGPGYQTRMNAVLRAFKEASI